MTTFPVPSSFKAFELVAAGQPLRAVERPVRDLADGEVLLRVAGCGLCHTDLGYAVDGVRTRAPLPLVLGHEISGHVVAAGSAHASLVGQAVVVPAVLPCGACLDCLALRPTVCARQFMPGNDGDGGFASHVVVPGRGLCPVPGAGDDADAPLGNVPGLTLRHLSVVADAVSTAYQSVLRSGAGPGTLVVVVGLGGVGGFAAQIAADLGATVVGLDVSPERLESLAASLALSLDPRSLSPKDLKKRLVSLAREKGLAETAWAILECSGTPAGQATAYGLLVPAATLMVVGYTREEIPVRLSNLMAFDARAIGNWGCAPDLYPPLLERVLDGRYRIVETCELRPLSACQQAFDDVREHRARKRIVLVPEEP